MATHTKPNRVPLMAEVGGEFVRSNFMLSEFTNQDGVAFVHPLTLNALQSLRNALCARYDGEVQITITDAFRTQEELEELADAYGWTDQGGLVSRGSKHLLRFGGTAVDIKAIIVSTHEHVPPKVLGELSRKFFLFVKDDYTDGHVHVDQWDRSKMHSENMARLVL